MVLTIGSSTKNNFKILLALALLTLIVSCRSESSLSKGVYGEKGKNSSDFKPAYVVDTVTIERPIGVFLTKGNESATLYLSEADLPLLKSNNLEKIIAEPNIYLAGQNLFAYPLPKRDFEQVSGCMGIKREVHNESITILRSVKPLQKFILLLVEVGYYNKVESHLHGYRALKTDMDKAVYIKVLLPLCEAASR